LCGHSSWFMKALTGSLKVNCLRTIALNFLIYVGQEASEKVLDIHDDNPEHFEIMLKYLYTYKYETPDGVSDFEKQFIIPIGLHTLADKYVVEGLGARAVEAFGYDKSKILDADECEQLVQAHYEYCAQVDSPMGQAITGYILVVLKSFMYTDMFAALVQRYPILGADIVFAEKRGLCLGKCTKVHKSTR
jgi:hypothetical protein